MAVIAFPFGSSHLRFVVGDGAVHGDWVLGRGTPRWSGTGGASRDAKAISSMVAAWRAGRTIPAARVVKLLPERPEFFVACWKACLRIPRGQTRSYAWLAKAAGRPSAVRAAAQSMARNPLPLLVPCHRVTGTNDPGGFCGAGHMGEKTARARRFLALKDELLRLEGARTARD